MSNPYQEVLEGVPFLRQAPSERHEAICSHLHALVAKSMAGMKAANLLSRRMGIMVTRTDKVCPDLALITAVTGKLWLAAEIIDAGDNQPDTVIKKQIYEQIRLPRLWVIDPRYNNVEIYHGTEFGLKLKGILAGKELLTEKLLPEFQITIAELFAK